ncbi:gamma-glutamyltransferase family protein [Halomonas nitroreducens]|uniref:Gamma-glutamyltransferase family protein n=1 Tax=Halomonas nitroreducens TaxID=447425 RepID=A0A431V8A0_9GAMM|nr:gamma-glutamyltransferase family protein [Halomonas nitroreducens]RTR06377.1 gamma-glutamyltransferase family protein [Halomonas nitroreducens]
MERHPPPFRRRLGQAVLGTLLVLIPPLSQAESSFEYQRPDASDLGDQARLSGEAAEPFAIVTPHPLASDVGHQVLAAGGSAIDAAVAAQLVLALVHPQSSGIGGGGFLMHFDGEQVRAFDGRESAPAGVDETLFMDGEGKPLTLPVAASSGRAVGVPGMLRMLEVAHKAHGRLAWASLVAPAITLAEQGVPVSHRLHHELAAAAELADDGAVAALYFTEDDDPLPAGNTLTNPALAAILRLIAEQGSSALHTGAVAEDLVARVQGHPELPGAMSLEDLATYVAKEREPLCVPWRRWRVCGFPPPSSGHLSIMQMLGMLAELSPLEAPLEKGRPTAAWLHRFVEASRLALADRNRYIADPGFVDPPGGDWSTLLADDYLASRADLIGEQRLDDDQVGAGNPGALDSAWAMSPVQAEHGTSHISVIDAAGQAVAVTTSVGQSFGARLLADGGTGKPGGYLLNSGLTDFSFRPADQQGTPFTNRVAAGKRPRSSMSPTLVFDRESGDLVASLGTSGGAAIVHYLAKTLVALLDWQLDPATAIGLPHVVTREGLVRLEADGYPEAVRSALAERGHDVETGALTSGLQVLRRGNDGLVAASDPRGGDTAGED